MESTREEDGGFSGLDRLFIEWKNLTASEFEKIEVGDWKGLERLQSKKACLQQSIEEMETAFSNSPNLSDESKAAEKKRIRQIASELLVLEKRNEALLSERIAEADRQLKNSDKTLQSLRRVQKAYGSGGHSFWQSYS